MNNNIRFIIMLIIGLFSFLGHIPKLDGQSMDGKIQSNKTTLRKIIIIEDDFQGEKKELVKQYVNQLTKWSETSEGSNLSKLPEVPEKLKNVSVNANIFQVNDTQKIVIQISDVKIDREIKFKKKDNGRMEESGTNGETADSEVQPIHPTPPPPPRGPRRDRMEDRKGMRRINKANKIVSQSRFNLAFLNVIERKKAGVFPAPWSTMPELDAGNTLQIGFEHSWGLNLIKGKVRAWIGVTYDIQNYRFENNQVRLDPHSRDFNYIIDNNPGNPDRIADKSKLVTNYLGIPISIGFQNKKRNPTFSMKLGIQASALVRSHSKVRFLNGDKEKFFTDFGLNDYADSPFAFLQFKHLGIYAKYGMTDIFKKSPNRITEPSHNFAIGFTLSTNIN